MESSINKDARKRLHECDRIMKDSLATINKKNAEKETFTKLFRDKN